ncbi:MAG: LrgB family protein, partial [Odoribacter sp.]|nr:LrgB family protein [Odoribacter sp.]
MRCCWSHSLGSAAHGLGTARAMELGTIEGYDMVVFCRLFCRFFVIKWKCAKVFVEVVLKQAVLYAS